MSKTNPKDIVKNCVQQIKSIHLNWIEINAYLFKWIPFSVIVGLIVGIVASLFDLALIKINALISNHTAIIIFYALFVATLTGVLSKNDERITGPGINYILSRDKNDITFISFIKKTILSLFALAGVFVAGREGPSFFLGSYLSSSTANIFKISEKFERIVGLIGAGAFTAALLKAPLGAAVFVLEIRYVNDMEYEGFPQVLIASIVSYSVFAFLRGKHSLLTINGNLNWHIPTLIYLVLTGIFIAVASYIFISLYYFAKCNSSYLKTTIRPFVGVLLALPIIVILAHEHNLHLISASVDYLALTKLSIQLIPINKTILLILATMLLVSLTVGFGISGGLILPSLIIGALIGNGVASIFNLNPTLFALSGMAAFLSASAKTPLAAIILVLEISQTDLIIPLTTCVVVSYILSYGVGVYSSQKECKLNLNQN